jgi:hypothetical protein
MADARRRLHQKDSEFTLLCQYLPSCPIQQGPVQQGDLTGYSCFAMTLGNPSSFVAFSFGIGTNQNPKVIGITGTGLSRNYINQVGSSPLTGRWMSRKVLM